MELPTSSPLIKRAPKGVARSHGAVGTPERVRRPISWDVFLGDQGLVSCGARAAECFGCLSRWAICFCGEVGQNRLLGDQSSTPRALFDKKRRSVVPGGATVDLVAVAPGD